MPNGLEQRPYSPLAGGLRPHLIALGVFSLVALVLTGSALVGRHALGPDRILDWDPLLRSQAPPAAPPAIDCTPILLHYPKDLAVAAGLRAGRIDEWNPLAGCGTPLWAEQSGPFFPLKLPFYLLPSRQTYDLFLALRLVFAALGAYALGRYRGLAWIPAIAAGAAFELSGALIAALPFAVSSPIYVLPWVILGSYAINARRSLTSGTAAGLALGLAGSGGHPTLVVLVFAAFAVAIAGHMAAAWRNPRIMLQVAGLGALAMVVGLALAAPTLLPLAALAEAASSYKHRPIGAQIWRLDLSESRTALPISLFASGMMRGLLPEAAMPLAYGSVIGALGVVAALGGIIRGRIDAALVAIGAFGLVLATMPPGLGWFHDLPGLSLILPTYAWPLVVLPLSQAAGRGIEVASDATRGAVAMALALAVLVIGTTVLGVLGHRGWAPLAAPLTAGAGGSLQLLLPVGLAIAVAGASIALGRAGRGALAAAVFTFCMIGEQLFTMAPVALQAAATVLSSPPSPAVAFLQHQLADGNGRFVAIPHRVGFPLSPMLFGLADVRAMSALPISRYYDYLHAVSGASGGHTTQDVPVVRSPLLDLAAVRYVVVARVRPRAAGKRSREEIAEALWFSPPAMPLDDPTLPLVYEDERVQIYENRNAVPRVRIVHDALATYDEGSAQLWAAAVGDREASAGELGLDSTIVIEPGADGTRPPTVGGGPSAAEQVRITDATQPDRLVLEATLERPGFVVVADTYYPGWTATVDGIDTPIFPADLLFRAVFVPAGTHTIVFTFASRAFAGGVAAAVVAALGCVAVWLIDRRRAAVPTVAPT